MNSWIHCMIHCHSFQFSIWANLCVDIGHVDLTLAARRSIAMSSWSLFLGGINVYFEWLHLPTVGVRDVFAGVLGLLLMTAGEGLRGVVKGTAEHEASFCGRGLAESMWSIYSLKCLCNQKPLSSYLSDLSDTSLLPVSIFKSYRHLVSMTSLPPFSSFVKWLFPILCASH